MAVGDASESADGQRRANPVAESVEEVTSSGDGCHRSEGRWSSNEGDMRGAMRGAIR